MVVPRTATALGSSALVASLLLAACSGGGSGGGEQEAREPVTDEEREEALSTPTTLTFWTWVPNIEDEVALFEEEYPEIDVRVENVGQGAEHYQQLRTALSAGEGLPDVAQMEYQYISSFLVSEALLDLSPYGAGDLEDNYVEWVWNQVSQEDAVYGIPQDIGPMGHLYRQDIFEEAGISEPPATYEEYAQAAEQVKSQTDSFISNLPPNQAGQMIGFLWQAGVKPFGYDGAETVSISVNSDEAKQVMSYWQDLVQQDLVSIDPDFNDQWYQGLATGKYAGWLTAAWGPVFLSGTAGETSGKWRAAPLPQWDEGTEVSGNWGGSSDAVLAASDNPIAAYELAKFINYNKASTMMLATEQFLFPPQKDVLEDPEFVEHEAEFYGGQQVNSLFADISETVDTEFEWLPFMDFVYSSYEETMGSAISSKGDMVAALDTWQEQLVTYAEDQGFTVEE